MEVQENEPPSTTRTVVEDGGEGEKDAGRIGASTLNVQKKRWWW